jgi:hypothetical protein
VIDYPGLKADIRQELGCPSTSGFVENPWALM